MVPVAVPRYPTNTPPTPNCYNSQRTYGTVCSSIAEEPGGRRCIIGRICGGLAVLTPARKARIDSEGAAREKFTKACTVTILFVLLDAFSLARLSSTSDWEANVTPRTNT